MVRPHKLVWLLGALISYVVAVDRGNFKTCQQSGFCKRQRNYHPAASPYEVLLDTVSTENNRFSVQVVNTQNNIKFLLEFSALEGSMARMKMNELDPLKPRYEIPVGDCLVQEPPLDKLTVSERSNDKVTLSLGEGTHAHIQARPLRVDIVAGGEPVMTVNAAGLLKFEHLRTKNEPGVMAGVYNWIHDSFRGEDAELREEGDEEEGEEEEGEEEEEENNEGEEPDMWEEKFKTHTDSKPNGPSSIGVDISFPGYEFVYGIPEHADTLALKSTKNGEPYRLYNLDVFEYELDNSMALYGSVPVMYAHNAQRTVGVFWQNAAETWIDISSNIADKGTFSKLVDFVKGGDSEIPQVDTHWMSESGVIDVFFLLGPKPQDVMQQYGWLTGFTPLPPLFALAYHQSRWNYNDEQDVANVNAGFDTHDIPMDVLWLDIEHTDGKRYFTWDAHKFSHSVEMLNNVSAVGRKMVTIVDPHIKKDNNYKVYKEARDLGYFIKDKSDSEYEGWCWPGSSAWPDFVDPAIRDWWARKFMLNDYEGSTLALYTWNDMNEPSVFNGPEITMHKDARHFGEWEHRDVHNIYGTYVHRATFEGHLMRAEHTRRPFVLSRAFFAGSQRWGAVWTGDNTADWGHLKASLPMLMTLNLVGITFSGADIGGFFKNPEAELLTRWYQAAAYQPFMRAHAHLDTKRREPWLLPEENTKAIRAAIRARYSLLPYWYTLFAQSETTGEAIMKPLWIDFPADRESFAIQDEHLVGSALLVHPVTDKGASGVNVYLPGEDELWYEADTYKVYSGGQKHYIPTDLYKIPVFQRGGTIVPRKDRIRRASSLTHHDPYTLVVALDKQGAADGELYIDEYDSFNYADGACAWRHFTFRTGLLKNTKRKQASVAVETRSWLERVVVMGVPSQPKQIVLSGPGVEMTRLEGSYDPHTRTLVIRKPGVSMAADWTIALQ